MRASASALDIWVRLAPGRGGWTVTCEHGPGHGCVERRAMRAAADLLSEVRRDRSGVKP